MGVRMRLVFPPGTVVRYSDDHGGLEDRSYRVVFDWDEGNGTVRVKHTINPGPEFETAKTRHLVILGWCDRDGHMTWA